MNYKKHKNKKKFYSCPNCGYKRKTILDDAKEVICSNCFHFFTLLYLNTVDKPYTKSLQSRNRILAKAVNTTPTENREFLRETIEMYNLDIEVL